MRLARAERVGAQHGADQQHARPRRAHHARQHGADGEQRGVGRRSPHQRAAQQHPAAGGVQREEQHDEGQVFLHQHEGDLRARLRQAEHQREGQQERRAPGGGDLAAVVAPDRGCQNRQQRDGQQHAREG